ncbi:hypothetical protein [Calycomorphotria hydatis]|uniref:Uncharacterized protein n=1 Tax=Calycomorphotria hydatis TaxID=2528027 RepID=A0A517TDM5_9PLAN|nr:hypothetical protein [Calycomorphotria hydatis]QDT66474.1 hypothetical protein V22_37420 [Calycomorphotria hydatis]
MSTTGLRLPPDENQCRIFNMVAVERSTHYEGGSGGDGVRCLNLTSLISIVGENSMETISFEAAFAVILLSVSIVAICYVSWSSYKSNHSEYFWSCLAAILLVPFSLPPVGGGPEQQYILCAFSIGIGGWLSTISIRRGNWQTRTLSVPILIYYLMAMISGIVWGIQNWNLVRRYWQFG